MNSHASFEAATGLPEVVGYIFAFVLGTLVGSFLNVVIHRVPRQQSIVFPNSACPACGTRIRSFDNLPVLSWLLLRGKCRKCGEPISIRYLAVELLTGLLFLAIFLQLGLSPLLPVWLIFAAVMVVLVFIDAEHMILPNVITYPLLVFSILVRLSFALLLSANYFPDAVQWPLTYLSAYPLWVMSLAASVLGALAGGGSLWLVGEVWKKLRGVEAMGMGDVKMMLGVGALLGWKLTVLSIFLAAFAGSVVGIWVIFKQKEKDLQAQIPFGIFLGIGSIIALLAGEQIITWYLRSFIR